MLTLIGIGIGIGIGILTICACIIMVVQSYYYYIFDALNEFFKKKYQRKTSLVNMYSFFLNEYACIV
jgi:hypothetical protein